MLFWQICAVKTTRLITNELIQTSIFMNLKYFSCSISRTFLSLFFLILVHSLHGQGLKNRCQNGPMDRTQFQQQKQFVGTRQGVFAQMEAAQSLSTSHCLSSEQVKEIASLFQNDFDRLEYAKHAWYSVYDKDEYFIVLDAFIQASSLFRLYDFIQQERGQVNSNPSPNPNPGPPAQPSIQYPDAAFYMRTQGCNSLMNDAGFQQVLSGVRNQMDDNARMNYLKGLWTINCFSVAQTMMIASEFQNEAARLQFLKNASTRVFDTGNLNYATQVFSNQNFRKDWAVFLAGQNTTTTTNNPTPVQSCQVSQESMTKIIASLNQQAVNSSRVNLAKQQIQVNKCFTARQIKSIVGTIAVESGRLEVMKFGYEFTIDKPEYLNILDVLSVQSSRDEIIGMVR